MEVNDAAPNYVDATELTCANCMVQNSTGAVYTRWGSAACPMGQRSLYSGYMVGQYSGTGAGAGEYLCLTDKMHLNEFVLGNQGGASDVFHVEFAPTAGLQKTPMDAGLAAQDAVGGWVAVSSHRTHVSCTTFSRFAIFRSYFFRDTFVLDVGVQRVPGLGPPLVGHGRGGAARLQQFQHAHARLRRLPCDPRNLVPYYA